MVIETGKLINKAKTNNDEISKSLNNNFLIINRINNHLNAGQV